MSVMGSGETFDGKPPFDVPDILPRFEPRVGQIPLYDPALLEALQNEGEMRGTNRDGFMELCMRLGTEVYELYDGVVMVLRKERTGLKRVIDFMAPKYFLSQQEQSNPSTAYTVAVMPGSLNTLMDQSKKHNIDIDEALERNLRMGIEVSIEQRLEDSRLYRQTPLGKLQPHFVFPIVKNQKS